MWKKAGQIELTRECFEHARKTMEAQFGLEKKAENCWVVRLRTPAKE